MLPNDWTFLLLLARTDDDSADWKFDLATFPLDAITATLFADIDEAMTALQDILVVPGIAHLASEAPTRRAPMDALESARVLTFVIIL
jgi:hypothetical protein